MVMFRKTWKFYMKPDMRRDDNMAQGTGRMSIPSPFPKLEEDGYDLEVVEQADARLSSAPLAEPTNRTDAQGQKHQSTRNYRRGFGNRGGGQVSRIG